MHRPRRHQTARSIRWLFTLAVILLAVPLGVARAQVPDTTTMGPDQLFLRHRLQSHVGLTLLVHETLHRTGTFPSKADAQKVDQRLDDEVDRMKTALRSIYNDTYNPQPRDMAHSLADSLAKLGGPKYDFTFRNWVIEYDRLEILDIDKAMPKLTNATVRALAQKMRASASSEMAALQAVVNLPVPT
jgi:uncharacterized protein (DUF305 family)